MILRLGFNIRIIMYIIIIKVVMFTSFDVLIEKMYFVI